MAARSAASFMDGFVEAKEAAGAAQTHVNLGKTCTCMHILRATSDPQGHHGRAQRPGEQGFSNVFTNTKKTRSVRTIILPAVSRRDLCYASENEGFRFLLWVHYSLLFATIRHYSTLFATIRHHYTQLYATIWLSDE